MEVTEFDYLVVGGGIIGLTIARKLAQRPSRPRVALLEKEPKVGLHASGRNSGVVHAGLYYPPGSLKAKLCVDGARQLREYATKNKLPIDAIGKVLVVDRKERVGELELIHERAQKNGVRSEMISEARLKEIEPEARSAGSALLSPDTAVIDSKAVLHCLQAEVEALGVKLVFGEAAEELDPVGRTLHTRSHGLVRYGHLVNCAGAYADKLAHRCGLGLNYELLPFRGAYVQLDPSWNNRVRHLIYPTPDLNLPFLGVHVTKAVTGKIWIGPTALPALGREHYHGVSGIDWSALPVNVARLGGLWVRNSNNLRRHVALETKRLFSSQFLHELQELMPNVRAEDLTRETKSGIRAQLVDTQKRALVMDFVVEKSESSTHVLNAVSPAFTAGFAFADWLDKSIA